MSPAAKKLRELLDARGRGARKELATKLGVGQEQITKWLTGKPVPSIWYRTELFRLCDIPILEWGSGAPKKKAARNRSKRAA